MYETLRTYINNYSSQVITDDEFEIVKNSFFYKKWRKRQYMLQEGDICKYSAFVLKGILRQYRLDEKGDEHVIHFSLENNWMIDQESFITHKPSSTNIDAVEDTEVLLIDHVKLRYLKNTIPAILIMSDTMQSQSVIAIQKRINSSISYTASQKYTELLETFPQFIQRIPMSMIASYLGISPETISRVRKLNVLKN
jgi:CRP-like cAMP-binding protein